MSDSSEEYVSESIKFQHVLYSRLKKKGFYPENGSELFVRHIPTEDTAEDLLDFFQTAGEVFQIRLMMSETGAANRGFGYVTFFDAATAQKAKDSLNLLPYKEERYLQLESSLNNCRLFIGGIPTYKRKDQVWQELYTKGVKNIIDVIMYRSYSDRAENRGFVFVEFRTHEEAAHFRAKYGKTLRLWDSPVVVDWSVPIPQIDETVMNSVKIIYLRNLDVCQTREQLHTIILNFCTKAAIEKVYKFKNYAFIHLTTRQHAEKLLEGLKEHYRSTVVEVTWAKPPSKFTNQDYRHSRVSHLSTKHTKSFTYESPSSSKNSCSCNCKKNKNSLPALSPANSLSPMPSAMARSLSPYDSYYREFYSRKNDPIPTSSRLYTYDDYISFDKSLPDFDIDARRKHDCSALEKPSSGLGILNLTMLSHHISTLDISGVTPPEMSPLSNVTHNFSPTQTESPREEHLENFQRNMEGIYGINSPNSSLSYNSHNVSLQDLEVLPRDITLDDIQILRK